VHVSKRSKGSDGRERKAEEEGNAIELDDGHTSKGETPSRGSHTNPIFMLVKPIHKGKHVARKTRAETEGKEERPQRWMTLEAVVHNGANACADEPVNGR
jgi:hypothetical protein